MGPDLSDLIGTKLSDENIYKVIGKFYILPYFPPDKTQAKEKMMFMMDPSIGL